MQSISSSAWLNELLADHQPPCVSIYLPMQRAKPPAEQNRVLFRDLMDKAHASMQKRYKNPQIQPVMEKLGALADDELLRGGPRDGLAVFASADYLRVIELPRPVNASVEVADSFHIKPLVRVMQQGVRFQVLCLSPKNVRLLEGNQYQMREMPLDGVPRNINETLKGFGRDVPNEPYGQQQMRRGQPPTDKDNMGIAPFLRAVDRAIWEHRSRDAKLPMVVCADQKHLAEFLALTKNQHVLAKGIPHNPDHLSDDRLREEAWRLIEPEYLEELDRLNDQFRTAKAHQKGSDELMQVAEAAAVGRVGTLLIDEQAKIPGILHRASGLIESASNHPQSDPRAEDVLDDLAELVLQKDGQVYVIPHEQMPTYAGLAAVYRY